jgi:methionine-gamma-lyase
MNRFDPMEALATAAREGGPHGGVNTPVEASSTFAVPDAGAMEALIGGRVGPADGRFVYGRHFHPTVYALGRRLAALEGAEAAYCTASGMSATAAVVLQLCDHGDHAVCGAGVYGGTHALFKEYLPAKTGLRVTFADPTDPRAVAAALTDRTRLVYVETMSNPALRVADLPRLAAVAHAGGARLVVDNTFCPLVVSPLLHGADVVVHSLTKFISGASDLIAGAVCGTTEFVTGLMDLHRGSLLLLGPTMDPTAAHAIGLRLPHLGLRVAEHGRRALLFAGRLREAGLPVTYPGLPGHPDHALLRRIANEGYGSGGVFGIDLGTARRAATFMEALQNEERFGLMAVSLGYFETLMCSPAGSTSSELGEEELRRAGVSPGFVRVSVGYTGGVEERWRQLSAALRRVGAG